MRRRTLNSMAPGFDLRSDPWIPGLRVDDAKASALAASLRLDAQAPCSACGEASWLRRNELTDYNTGTPLLCVPCLGDAFVKMPARA